MKNKFGFILVKPQLGENIGACARSMKNFGFNKLHIVEPKINFPNHKAKATSVGAYDIINKTKSGRVFDYSDKVDLKQHILELYNRFKTEHNSLDSNDIDQYSYKYLSKRLSVILDKTIR